MKVCIADKVSSQMVKDIERTGAQVTYSPNVSEAELAGSIGDSHVLIVRSKKVNAAAITAAQHLALIVRAGAGVNTIDLDTANERGIQVANCPGQNADAVAELAIALLAACDRRVVQAHNEMAAGNWNKKEYQKARGLKGRTLGVLGLGAIGTAMAARAKGLQMNVVAWSRSLTPDKARELGVGYCATKEIVAETADAVSIHLAFTKELKHLINRDFFGRMKKGAILINTSRGDLVDTAALKAAIQETGIRAGRMYSSASPPARRSRSSTANSPPWRSVRRTLAPPPIRPPMPSAPRPSESSGCFRIRARRPTRSTCGSKLPRHTTLWCATTIA